MSKSKKVEATKLAKEFKDFILRGNVIDMAIGIIIGSAFTAIVSSFVADIFNPLLGCIIGDIDFSSLKLVLIPAAGDTAEVAIRYGVLLEKIISFLITALVLFGIIKATAQAKAAGQKLHDDVHKAEKEKAEADKKAAEEAAKAKAEADAAAAAAEAAAEKEAKATQLALLKEIRDLLKK